MDFNNYRGLALSFIFGKLLDLIILSKYRDSFMSSDLQFGFKAKRSTALCTMLLKEAVSYYVHYGNSVYCYTTRRYKGFRYC